MYIQHEVVQLEEMLLERSDALRVVLGSLLFRLVVDAILSLFKNDPAVADQLIQGHFEQLFNQRESMLILIFDCQRQDIANTGAHEFVVGRV